MFRYKSKDTHLEFKTNYGYLATIIMFHGEHVEVNDMVGTYFFGKEVYLEEHPYKLYILDDYNQKDQTEYLFELELKN
jgi:hypothetical protein